MTDGPSTWDETPEGEEFRERAAEGDAAAAERTAPGDDEPAGDGEPGDGATRLAR